MTKAAKQRTEERRAALMTDKYELNLRNEPVLMERKWERPCNMDYTTMLYLAFDNLSPGNQ